MGWSYLGLCCGVWFILFSISNRNISSADCFRKETWKCCSPAPHNHTPPGNDLLLLLKIHLHRGFRNSLQSPLICCWFAALYRSVMALGSSIHSQGWCFGCLLRSHEQPLLQVELAAQQMLHIGASPALKVTKSEYSQESEPHRDHPSPAPGPAQASPKNCSHLFQITPWTNYFPHYLLAAMATDPTELNPQIFSGIQLCSVKYMIKQSRPLPSSPGTQVKSCNLNSTPSEWS